MCQTNFEMQFHIFNLSTVCATVQGSSSGFHLSMDFHGIANYANRELVSIVSCMQRAYAKNMGGGEFNFSWIHLTPSSASPRDGYFPSALNTTSIASGEEVKTYHLLPAKESSITMVFNDLTT